MTSVYNANQPFEMVINFSDDRRVTYTFEQVATTAYDLIFSTRYFTNYYQIWNGKLSTEKMWANF